MILLIRFLRRRRKQRRAAQPPRPSGERTGLELVAHQTRFELLSFFRNRQSRFFTVALPIIFLVIFVSVFGNDKLGPRGIKASTYYVPGISALAIIAGSFVNLVIAIVTQRESGVLKRRRATPVPAWVLIAARALTSIVVSLGVMTILLLIGRFGYGVTLPTATLPGILLTAVVGSVSFCCLAFALTTAIKDEDAAQPTVQAIMLPLYFISGIFIPNVSLPTWLRDVAKVFPVQHLADCLHHAFDPATRGVGIVWSDIGVLLLWGAIGLAVALARFAWTPVAAAG